MSLIRVNTKFEKIPWDKHAVYYYALLAFTIILYTVFFEIPRIRLITGDIEQIILYSFMSAGISCVFFYLVYLSKWVNIIILPLLFYYGTLSKIYAQNFLLDTTMYTAPMFFNTNAAYSLIDENIMYLLLLTSMYLLGLAIAIIRFFICKDDSITRKGQAFGLLFIIAISTFSLTNKEIFKPNPYSFFSSTTDFVSGFISSHFQGKNRVEAITATKTDDNITGIVIFLDKLDDTLLKDNSSEIRDLFISSNFNIIHSIKREYKNTENNRAAIYTSATAENLNKYVSDKSFQSIIQNSKYNVMQVNLLSELSTIDFYSNSIIKFDLDNIYNYQKHISPDLYTSMDNITQFHKNNKGGLIVVNLENSSHIVPYRYNHHYEHKEKYYKYTNEEYAEYLKHIHGYLNKIISLYKDQKAFIFLVGINSEKNHETTAMITWSSKPLDDTYHSDLKLKSNSYDIIYTDTILHSLLGCFKMNSNNFDNNKNLCR